jgi:hypothetical protein
MVLLQASNEFNVLLSTLREQVNKDAAHEELRLFLGAKYMDHVFKA